jgi:hypothetical protein
MVSLSKTLEAKIAPSAEAAFWSVKPIRVKLTEFALTVKNPVALPASKVTGAGEPLASNVTLWPMAMGLVKEMVVALPQVNETVPPDPALAIAVCRSCSEAGQIEEEARL